MLDHEYNELVDRLEVFLRSVATSMNLDIEHVEVKGRVYVPHKKNNWVTHVEGGDLLKCPPSIEHLLQPAVDASTFVDVIYDPWPVTGEQLAHNVVAASATPKDSTAGQSPGSAISHYSDGKNGGSFKRHLVTEDMLSRLPKLDKFVRLYADRPTKVRDWKIAERRVSEIMLMFSLLKKNNDGSNPCARHEAFVKVLHEQGVFAYGWNHHVYKAVRDWMTKHKLLDWTDSRYYPGRFGEKGQASKWAAVPYLLEQVEVAVGVDEKKESIVFNNQHNNTLSDTQGVVTRPVLVLRVIDVPVLTKSVTEYKKNYPPNIVSLAA